MDSITFKFHGGEWIRISDNNRWFGCITSNKELHIIDLEKYTKDIYQDIESYSFSKTGDYLVALQKNNQAMGTLLVVNLNSHITTTIKDVKKYEWHPKQNCLLITNQDGNLNKIELYHVENLKFKALKESLNGSFSHLLWSDAGHDVVFTEQINQENYIHYYSNNGVLKTLDDATIEQENSAFKISNKAPYISKDGEKILFYRQIKKGNKEDINSIEIWNTEDPWIYPRMKDFEEREVDYLLTAWYPKTNKIVEIETKEKSTSALDVNHDYAIVFNKIKYEPLYKEFPNTDIYIKNMETGDEYLVVENQYTGPGFVTISPNGKYVSYFKNKHWWVYDIKKKQTLNITKEIGSSFENLERDKAGDIFPSGNPGWAENDEYIIIYDQHDIWLLSPSGNYKKRITKGREEKIKYRINKDYRRNEYYFLTINVNFSSSPLNMNKGLILELYDSRIHKTGYALWEKNKNIKKMIFEQRNLDGILTSRDYSYMVLRKQKFDEPPGIYGLNLNTNEEYLIYQSNEQLLDYDLGRAELIKYQVGEEILSGALIYPANFNPQKKYPMIVFIYEKLSGKINIFNPPTYNDFMGFNTLKYTTNDYFVLYADISYTIQDPGISALNCVISAVNKVLDSGFIDKNKIGLIGHSFGGYESAFIATQTDMFAAIVAGASVTNFTSHYHSVGWNWKQPEMWRYESQQWRMGDSYYNIKDAYLRNSPLQHIENVRTPLLLWTGKKDYQVHWTQSVEMFLALKRQGKKSKLLLFENETHVIMKRDNQKQLSKEVFNWFNQYCE
ncbi:S9 family peptidase [Xanthomarina sp.]|uniref:S9 family peptidase n=1 Tax=Xanthomarina sp. TaxID=1931211 RepID=UPI002D05656A|nr:prolyl oligopeptidase family serine peptidase [Xanthomarina sp.]HLV38546.1 prolyl oligopeptidase family serine peptidase [Xanthomarina sp.]